jgi:hypothetical protein
MSALPSSQPPDENPENTFENIFTLTRLRKTCQTIRKEARLLRARDVIDWLDWFIALESSLALLKSEILTGDYTPTPPTRYELAKARGSFRVITALNIRDAVVYRHLYDEALTRATPFKVQGAFFSRRRSSTPVGKTFLLEDDPYLRFFEIWLKYHQYRTLTLLNEPYEFIVVSDITNYFDSIQHDLLLEYLSPLGLPRKVIGLLGRLLEAFKPSAGHSPNPRVGLPVDELDCSRELAHLFLFEHDRRMVEEFGETNYVRWMDDQNIGVETETKARRVVNELTRSLASQRLTLNAGKTRFLSPEHVVIHFQLDANVALSVWDKEFNTVTEANSLEARKKLEEIWAKISAGDQVEKGHWDKILKRIYGLAVRANSDALETRALHDLIQYPELDERIFAYFAKRNRAEELLGLFESYCLQGENLFEATEAAFFEAALLLDPTPPILQKFKETARRYASGVGSGQSGRTLGPASAIIMLYWFGEPGAVLKALYAKDRARELPKEVVRAWMTLCCSAPASGITRGAGSLAWAWSR